MSRIKLSHNIIQLKGKVNESELIITVNYDTETKTVEEPFVVKCHNWARNVTTDMTNIFNEVFPNQLNDMVEQINWEEEYVAYLQSSPKLFEEEAA